VFTSVNTLVQNCTAGSSPLGRGNSFGSALDQAVEQTRKDRNVTKISVSFRFVTTMVPDLLMSAAARRCELAKPRLLAYAISASMKIQRVYAHSGIQNAFFIVQVRLFPNFGCGSQVQ